MGIDGIIQRLLALLSPALREKRVSVFVSDIDDVITCTVLLSHYNVKTVYSKDEGMLGQFVARNDRPVLDLYAAAIEEVKVVPLIAQLTANVILEFILLGRL
jgi:hypothetical protein